MPREMRYSCPARTPVYPLFSGWLGHEGQDQLDRSFLERTDRVAVFIAIDPSVRRIGRRSREAGDLEGLRVHPGAVMVGVPQHDRTIGDHGVERRGRGDASFEGLHGPAGARDPRLVGPIHVFADCAQIGLFGVRRLEEMAGDEFEAGHRRMNVRVLESRQQRPALEVDDVGGQRCQVPASDSGNRPPFDEDGRCARVAVDQTVDECSGHGSDGT